MAVSDNGLNTTMPSTNDYNIHLPKFYTILYKNFLFSFTVYTQAFDHSNKIYHTNQTSFSSTRMFQLNQKKYQFPNLLNLLLETKRATKWVGLGGRIHTSRRQFQPVVFQEADVKSLMKYKHITLF